MSHERPSKLGKLLSSLKDGRLVHLDQEITPSSDSFHIQVGEFRRSFQLAFQGWLATTVLWWVYAILF